MDVEGAREILTKFLKSNRKLRSTTERYAVLDTVLQIQGHFDADSLYYRMITKGVKISKATVSYSRPSSGVRARFKIPVRRNTSRCEKAFGRPQHHRLISWNAATYRIRQRQSRRSGRGVHREGVHSPELDAPDFGNALNAGKKVTDGT